VGVVGREGGNGSVTHHSKCGQGCWQRVIGIRPTGMCERGEERGGGACLIICWLHVCVCGGGARVGGCVCEYLCWGG
jgi:hypothetical protein